MRLLFLTTMIMVIFLSGCREESVKRVVDCTNFCNQYNSCTKDKINSSSCYNECIERIGKNKMLEERLQECEVCLRQPDCRKEYVCYKACSSISPTIDAHIKRRSAELKDEKYVALKQQYQSLHDKLEKLRRFNRKLKRKSSKKSHTLFLKTISVELSRFKTKLDKLKKSSSFEWIEIASELKKEQKVLKNRMNSFMIKNNKKGVDNA